MRFHVRQRLNETIEPPDSNPVGSLVMKFYKQGLAISRGVQRDQDTISSLLDEQENDVGELKNLVSKVVRNVDSVGKGVMWADVYYDIAATAARMAFRDGALGKAHYAED